MDNNSLYHHGIKGMRWGVRRYQNKNGTLTRAGRKRYANKENEKPKLTPEQERELKKSQVLESRSAKQLYENRKMFNYDEMNRAHKLLEVDDKVKKLIVKEPNKVEKFLTKAGDLATKIKDIVKPTVEIYKELEKLSGGDTNNKKQNNQNNQNGKKNGGEDKPPIDLNNLFSEMPDGPIYYDADWEPSGNTKSFVSRLLPGPKEDD